MIASFNHRWAHFQQSVIQRHISRKSITTGQARQCLENPVSNTKKSESWQLLLQKRLHLSGCFSEQRIEQESMCMKHLNDHTFRVLSVHEKRRPVTPQTRTSTTEKANRLTHALLSGVQNLKIIYILIISNYFIFRATQIEKTRLRGDQRQPWWKLRCNYIEENSRTGSEWCFSSSRV